jgi:baseplate J-like protein
MATGTVYLDVDDEITSAAARIRGSEATKVALVVPYGSRIATSRMNFRLLSREALVNNRRLSIVATDPATRALAASAGLPVFASVAEWDDAAGGTLGLDGSSSDVASASPVTPTASDPATPIEDEAPPKTPPSTSSSSRAKGPKPAALEQATLALPVAPVPASAASSVVAGPPVPRGLPPARSTAPSSAPSSAPSAVRSAPSRVSVARTRSMPQVGAPVLAVAAVLVLALVVAGVGAFLFLPSAAIVVTPRPEGIGPIALVVRADPDITSPNAAENLVPAQRLEVPVSASDTFKATDKRVEEARAGGKVEFQSLNTGSENTIAKGSIVSTEGGISFQTTATLTLPRAKVFPQFEPSTGTVGIVAVKTGTAGNVPANAITVVPPAEDPTLTKVKNPNPTAGGTHKEFPRIGKEDVDGAMVALQAKIVDAFNAALADGAGAPANATVFAETAELGESTPSVNPATLIGKEVASFDLGLTASGTVIAVDASPVVKIAESRLLSNVGADHRLVDGSVEIVPGDPTVSAGEVSFPVTAKATRVPILDPAELLGLIKGRTVAEARTILAQFGDVVITPWPEWVTSIPGIESRVTIEIVGQTGGGRDESPSPSESARPSKSPRPSSTPKPSVGPDSSASGLPVASPVP